jgi:ribonuclease HI
MTEVFNTNPAPIVIYTDGACSGNPGPCGIGFTIEHNKQILEIGEFIGHGTNNHAELTAISQALDELPTAYKGPIRLHTDSAWAIGVLGGWKATTNLGLIAKIKAHIRTLPGLEFIKVKGHAGVPGNVRADKLATQAVAHRLSYRQLKQIV